MEQTAVDYLLLAEQAVLKGIGNSKNLSDGCYVNYGMLNEQLALAHDIGSLRKRAENLLGVQTDGSAKNSSHKKALSTSDFSRTPVFEQIGATSRGDAVYFIVDNVLYKYAIGKDEDATMYRRKVPLRDVKMCCEAIAEVLRNKELVTVKDIEQSTHMAPPYKVQVILAALVAARVLENLGRGRYANTGASPVTSESLIDTLRQLPVRQQWINQYGKK